MVEPVEQDVQIKIKIKILNPFYESFFPQTKQETLTPTWDSHNCREVAILYFSKLKSHLVFMVLWLDLLALLALLERLLSLEHVKKRYKRSLEERYETISNQSSSLKSLASAAFIRDLVRRLTEPKYMSRLCDRDRQTHFGGGEVAFSCPGGAVDVA